MTQAQQFIWFVLLQFEYLQHLKKQHSSNLYSMKWGSGTYAGLYFNYSTVKNSSQLLHKSIMSLVFKVLPSFGFFYCCLIPNSHRNCMYLSVWKTKQNKDRL